MTPINGRRAKKKGGCSWSKRLGHHNVPLEEDADAFFSSLRLSVWGGVGTENKNIITALLSFAHSKSISFNERSELTTFAL